MLNVKRLCSSSKRLALFPGSSDFNRRRGDPAMGCEEVPSSQFHCQSYFVTRTPELRLADNFLFWFSSAAAELLPQDNRGPLL
jgi:hypothetical protein